MDLSRNRADLLKLNIETFLQKDDDVLKLVDFYYVYRHFCELGREGVYYMDYKTSMIETEKGVEIFVKFVLKLLNYGISRNTVTVDVRVDSNKTILPLTRTKIVVRELDNQKDPLFERQIYFNIWLPSNYQNVSWFMNDCVLNSTILSETDYVGIEVSSKTKNYYSTLKQEMPDNIKSWLLLNGIKVF